VLNKFLPKSSWDRLKRKERRSVQNRPARTATARSTLPDSSVREHDVESVTEPHTNQESSAIRSIQEALSQTTDPAQRRIYWNQAGSLPWSALASDLEVFSAGRIGGRGRRAETLRWNFPEVSPWDVHLDTHLLDMLLEERRRYATPLDGNMAGWERVVAEDAEPERSPAKALRLSDLIGPQGMSAPRVAKVFEHGMFLGNIDDLPWRETLPHESPNADKVLETDLGSQMDLGLIWAARSGTPQCSDPLRVLEVGGGYGRLAEALVANWPGAIHRHVLVDAVPSSLAAAHAYLTQAVPRARVRVLLRGADAYGGVCDSSDGYEVTIVPSWNLSLLPREEYNLVVNIESFQEMDPAYVSYWLGLMDERLVDGGLAYISNSRTYVNRTPTELPAGWSIEIQTETPRSWTWDHPTFVCVKGVESAQFAPLRRSLSRVWRFESLTS
jgi:hypothetical protein